MADLILNLKSSISLCVLLLFLGCESPKPYLPAKTHEGRNVYGYKFTHNTDEFIVSNNITIGANKIEIDTLNNMHFFLSESKPQLYYDEVLMLDIYFIDSLDTYYFEQAKFEYNFSSFVLDSSQINFVDIAYFNSEKRIISGNFEFNFLAIESEYSSADSTYTYTVHDSLAVSDGRFDFEY